GGGGRLEGGFGVAAEVGGAEAVGVGAARDQAGVGIAGHISAEGGERTPGEAAVEGALDDVAALAVGVGPGEVDLAGRDRVGGEIRRPREERVARLDGAGCAV